MAKIKGGPGNDVLNGTNVADTITGGDGNDIIHGLGGNDDIQGGNGNDTLFGDAGNDSLQGGDGNDYLDGGIGIDQLNGGNGNDILVWDVADSMRAGGSGFDILLVQGSGQFVDLTVLHKDQFRSMEEVDLNGSGSNTLKVSANSIHEGDHDINALTGTPDTLVVRLGTDDVVDKGTGWTEQTPQVHDGVLYRVYTKLNSALTTSTLLIESHEPIAIDDGPISFFDTGVHDTGNTNLLSNDFGAGGSAVTLTSLSSLSTTGTNDNLFTISQSGLDINITLLPAINALIPTDAVYFFGLKDNTAAINVSATGDVSVDPAGGLLEFLSSTQTIKVSFDYSIIDGLGGTDTGHATVTINGLDNRDLLVAGVAGGETLNGGNNGDLLISQGGADVLNGNGGDDYLVGNGGNDTLNGGSENDKLIGEQPDFRIIHSSVSGNIDDPIPVFGSDTLSGDDGDDKLYGDLLTLTLKAEGGVDTFNLVAFTNLTFGADTLNGGNGNDELVGDVGNVALIAINGNGSGAAVIEVVHMDFGADTLNGGNGVDNLYGDAKVFSLSATGAVGNGSDTRAEVSFNTFYFGNDTLDGGADDDKVVGDIGTLNLIAVAGTNGSSASLFGFNNGGAEVFKFGNDTLMGGLGNDILIGDMENLVITATPSPSAFANIWFNTIHFGNDIIYGGDGNDTLYGDSVDPLQLKAFLTVGPNNVVIGGNNQLFGGAGDDILYGGSGNDILDGGSGSDTFYGSDGTDSYTGGSEITNTLSYQLLPIDRGTDFFITGNGSGYVQKYVVPTSGPTTIQVDTFTGIDHFIGTDDFGVIVNGQFFFNLFSVNDPLGAYTFDGVNGIYNNLKDTLNYAGLTNNSSINVTVTGYGAHGSMNGTVVKTSDLGMSTDTFLNMGVIQGVTTGNNTFIGNTGNDSFTGWNGNDIFMGGAGNDVLNGGGGTDTALYTNAISGVTVNLNIAVSQNVGSDQGFDTLISIESLTGGSFGDILIGSGANNVLIGNDGADTITGNGGNDTIDGGAGIDLAVFSGAFSQYTLTPIAGGMIVADTVSGRDGTDTLISVEHMQFKDVRVYLGDDNNNVISTVLPLFKDSFDYGILTNDQNANLEARQAGGFLQSIPYRDLSGDAGSQLGVSPYTDALALNNTSGSNRGGVELSQNFNNAFSQGGLSVKFDAAPEVIGGQTSEWIAISVGYDPNTATANAINQGSPHFGILFRENGGWQAFDGGSVVGSGTYLPGGSLNTLLTGFELRMTDPTDGNPFNGVGQTTIDVYYQNNFVFEYVKGAGGYANNYIDFSTDTGSARVDNLVITDFKSNVLIGGAGTDTLIGADATVSNPTLLDGGIDNDTLMPGKNLSSGTYTLVGGSGIDTLSYQNIDSAVTVDLGIIGIAQNTIGAGSETLGDLFEVLQGSNFDDNLSFTQVATIGAPGVSKLSNISSETIEGMDGNDTIIISGTATGVGGSVGNEATISDQTSAQVTLASNILDAGAGTGAQVIVLLGIATGGNATDTFGNHALNGFTAISALVDIHDNLLISHSTIADGLGIAALAFGGSAGSTTWDFATVNTGANVADGLGSEAISAQALVENNIFSGGIVGSTMVIDAEATGGNTGPALYANQALNDAVAISAQVTVDGNHLDGYGSVTGDTFQITALATGGSAINGGFTANVSGFNPADNPEAHPEQLIPGGTAISAQALVHDNIVTEHGTADASLILNATAVGGNGNFFANYAFDGTVTSADVQVYSNALTGGSGNDFLLINAVATGGSGNQNSPGTIDTNMDVHSNTLDGGAGDDILQLAITVTPGMVNFGSPGTEQLTAQNNHMMGGEGNDTLIFNNAALLDPINGNILDGGNGFDTLLQITDPTNLDLTAPGVVGTIVQNIERVNLLESLNTLILDGTSVDNLNTSHELFVRGNASDTASIGAGWTFAGITSGAVAGDPLDAPGGEDFGITFYHYTQVVGADTVNLYVDTSMMVV